MNGPARPRILALWSAPRCRSTAFFRMMLERGDFTVLHEPFSYLAEFGHSAVDGDILVDQPQLLAAIRRAGQRRPVFFKDTTDERYPAVLADRAFLAQDAIHAFLIRDPALTIPSYRRINPAVRVDQIGFGHLHELFEAVRAATGVTPPVLDGEDLVADSAAMVAAFCAAVGIPYRAQALNWSAGERPEWSPSARWHTGVTRSNGFTAGSRDPGELDDVHADYLAYHTPYFQDLYARRLRTR